MKPHLQNARMLTGSLELFTSLNNRQHREARYLFTKIGCLFMQCVNGSSVAVQLFSYVL